MPEYLLLELAEIDRFQGPLLWVDARRPSDYRRGHLPGAIALDTFPYANERTDGPGLQQALEDWTRMFAGVGITSEDTVVFYDAGTENRSARPAFMLRNLGHPRSYVLHGGVLSWLGAGRSLEKGRVQREPSVDMQPVQLRRKDLVATADDVLAAIDSGKVALLDVRDRGEYDGRTRLQWNPRLGRIPGCKYVNWTDLLVSRSDFPSEVGSPYYKTRLLSRLQDDRTILDRLAGAGVTPQDEIIIYCQKSHRASTIFLALERLGFQRVKVYIGSFREWSRRPELPVERGRPTDKSPQQS